MGKWAGVTPYMFFCCAVFSFGNILYGLDVSSFGAIQTLPSWLDEFGEEINGKHTLGTQRKSIMNSAVWPGKLMGTLLFEPIATRLGMKKTALLCAVIQCIALIIELAAPNWQAYAAGRSIAYFAVGIVENVVPAYHAEISPAACRGFFAGSVQVFVHIGATWAAGVTKAYATETDRKGWIIPTAQQLIPGVVLLIMVPFCVESPRWLLLRGRKEEALASLNKLRSQKEVDSGFTEMEIAAMDAANQESRATKSRWIELFQGTYLRRSIIIALTFFFNEVTGQQFVNAYGPTFYQSIGLGAKTFTYNIIVTLCGLIACLIAIFSNDRIGRVPLVLLSVLLTTMFNALVAGLGDINGPTTTQRNVVIASIILINFSAKLGVSSQCYTIGSEIGGTRMRKKMMGFGTAIDVCSAFLVTFFTPYLQNGPHIQLHAKTAFIWMGASIIAFFFFLFQLPELNGRSLEEVDELFEQRLWAWQFRRAVTTGVGSKIGQLEARREHKLQRDRERGAQQPDEEESVELK